MSTVFGNERTNEFEYRRRTGVFEYSDKSKTSLQKVSDLARNLCPDKVDSWKENVDLCQITETTRTRFRMSSVPCVFHDRCVSFRFSEKLTREQGRTVRWYDKRLRVIRRRLNDSSHVDTVSSLALESFIETKHPCVPDSSKKEKRRTRSIQSVPPSRNGSNENCVNDTTWKQCFSHNFRIAERFVQMQRELSNFVTERIYVVLEVVLRIVRSGMRTVYDHII